jgi:acyl-lipid (7-3)-desaturase (Delta-4 desaturase)
MAPDADKLRRRRGDGAAVAASEASSAAAAPEEQVVLSSVKSLSSNQVVIDGAIYDLTNFQHPGGDSIYLFGGNDVTELYKMIHPYHTAKHLEKLQKVGTISDYSSE